MREELLQVIALQRQFSARNTPEMRIRGELIRRALPREMSIATARIRRALGPYGEDLEFQGRDGTGQKTYIPWVRFFSRGQSPSAQQGWYCVYLFEASGKGVYLALAHGSTTLEDGDFKPKPAEHLAALVAWGRTVVGNALSEEPTLGTPMDLGGRTLGDAYERSTVLAKWYGTDDMPSDDHLYGDLERFAGLLRRIYDAHNLGQAPSTLPPEIIAVVRTAAGKSSGGGQGYGLTAAERKAVEIQAMSVAKQHLKGLGWSVQDVSADRPYDFLCRRKGEELIVEVKGTTGGGEKILITHGEVVAQRNHYPNNALIVVHSIKLEKGLSEPQVSGGTLLLICPWQLEDTALTPLAYAYNVSQPPHRTD
jgi:hypothetical protein